MSSVLVHKHLIIRAEVKNPPVNPVYVKDKWLPWLVELIGMKILIGPHAVYHDVVGNRGLTAFAIIETSHIALHVWDEDTPALMQLDIYTCGQLDPMLAASAITEFAPSKIEMKYLDREHGLIEIPMLTDEEIQLVLGD